MPVVFRFHSDGLSLRTEKALHIVFFVFLNKQTKKKKAKAKLFPLCWLSYPRTFSHAQKPFLQNVFTFRQITRCSLVPIRAQEDNKMPECTQTCDCGHNPLGSAHHAQVHSQVYAQNDVCAEWSDVHGKSSHTQQQRNMLKHTQACSHILTECSHTGLKCSNMLSHLD